MLKHKNTSPGMHTAPGTHTASGTYTASSTYPAPGTYTASGTYTAPRLSYPSLTHAELLQWDYSGVPRFQVRSAPKR